jgi:hypothetical protein
MKYLMLMLSLLAVGCGAEDRGAQEKDQAQSSQERIQKKATLENQVVEAACGQCKFGLSGRGCDLALKVDGYAYYADGVKLDHSKMHQAGGYCVDVRRAKVSGALADGRVTVKSYELLPMDAK